MRHYLEMIMIKWIKALLRIIRDYDKDHKCLLEKAEIAQKQVLEAKQVIIDRTSISADVSSYQKRNIIIVTGNYKKRGYVQTFQLDSNDFSHFIDTLKDMKKYGRVDYVDSPPQMRHVFERDF